MVDIAHAKLSNEEIEKLVSNMFEQASSNRRMSLDFKDFRDTLLGKLDFVWDVCLDFKGMTNLISSNMGITFLQLVILKSKFFCSHNLTISFKNNRNKLRHQ